MMWVLYLAGKMMMVFEGEPHAAAKACAAFAETAAPFAKCVLTVAI